MQGSGIQGCDRAPHAYAEEAVGARRLEDMNSEQRNGGGNELGAFYAPAGPA